jgi:hypothetical protein
MGWRPPNRWPSAARIGLTLQESFRVLTGEPGLGPADEYTRRYVAHADRVMTGMTTVYEPAAAVLATMRTRGVRHGHRVHQVPLPDRVDSRALGAGGGRRRDRRRRET